MNYPYIDFVLLPRRDFEERVARTEHDWYLEDLNRCFNARTSFIQSKGTVYEFMHHADEILYWGSH